MKAQSLINKQFGRLTVVAHAGSSKHGKRILLCQCSCGNAKRVLATNLIQSHTNSCGCLVKERFRPDKRYIGPNKAIHRPDGVTELLIGPNVGGETATVLIDTALYPLVAKERFRIGNLGYVVTHTGKRIHRMLMPGVKLIDHRNHSPLDNRLINLRPATHSQNSQNSRKRANTSSQFKGVSWNRTAKKWHSYIKVDGKRMTLGYFKDEEQAGIQYNLAASEYFGEFAHLNPIPHMQQVAA
jgi:hypothetical protein